MKNVIKSIFAAVFTISCGDIPVEQDLQQMSQELEFSYVGGGWNAATWEHQECQFSNGETCYFPGLANHSSPSADRYFFDEASNYFGSSWGLEDAMATAKSTWESLTTWDFKRVTSCPGLSDPYGCADVIFRIDDSISGYLTPNQNIMVSQVMHYACVDGTNLTEVEALDHMNVVLCDRAVVSFDVESFLNWMSGWTTNINVKKQMIAQLITHVYGVSVGVGSTLNPGTAMRYLMVRNQPTLMIEPYQVCMAENIYINRSPGQAKLFNACSQF